MRVFRFYIGASSEGALTVGLDNKNLILTNRTADMINEDDVLYVVCRVYRMYSKFSKNPQFRLMFNAGNVTVFYAAK